MLQIYKIQDKENKGLVSLIIVIDARTTMEDLKQMPRRVSKAIVTGDKQIASDVLDELKAQSIPVDWSLNASKAATMSFQTIFAPRNPAFRRMALSFNEVDPKTDASDESPTLVIPSADKDGRTPAAKRGRPLFESNTLESETPGVEQPAKRAKF